MLTSEMNPVTISFMDTENLTEEQKKESVNRQLLAFMQMAPGAPESLKHG